jgi:hypothetical protein
MLALISLGTQGCNKNEETKKEDTKASAAQGCGSDYADPQKEFCVTIPTGYTPEKPSAPTELYSELINFNGPMSGFTISVGFSSSNWKTFDDELKADDSWLKTGKGIKIESSGKTAGTGQWWVYTQDGTNQVSALVKSNGDKAIHCSPNNTSVAPEVIAACKSVRAYPK